MGNKSAKADPENSYASGDLRPTIDTRVWYSNSRFQIRYVVNTGQIDGRDENSGRLQILWIPGPYFKCAAHSTPVCSPNLVLVALLDINETRLSAATKVGKLTAKFFVIVYFPGTFIRETAEGAHECFAICCPVDVPSPPSAVASRCVP